MEPDRFSVLMQRTVYSVTVEYTQNPKTGLKLFLEIQGKLLVVGQCNDLLLYCLGKDEVVGAVMPS